MLRFILLGQEANPKNAREMEFTLDFRSRKIQRLEPIANTLTFVREDRERILDFIDTYSEGQGMPMDIEFSNESGNQIIPYFLKFTDENFFYNEKELTCSFMLRNAQNSFFMSMDGLSFEVVPWQNSDFKNVDYVIVKEDGAIYFITLAITTFLLTKELIQSIKDITEGIADVVQASIPTGIPPTPNFAAIAAAVIKLAARIAYAIAVVIALTKLIVEILNLIFPKVRQFKSISIKKLIERCVVSNGYTLQSSLLDQLEPLTIIPVPLRKKNTSIFEEIIMPNAAAFTKGYPTARDTIQAAGQALDFVAEVFNAEIKVYNNVVIIEREDFFINSATKTVKSSYNNQSERLHELTFNNNELYKRKVFVDRIDVSDVNTLDDNTGRIRELSSELISSPFPDIQTIEGYEQIQIPFAPATRKGDLNAFEKGVKVLAKAVDFFTGGNASAVIEARKGKMQISNQYFSVTKWAWTTGSNIHPQQRSFIGSNSIEANYHSNKRIQNNRKKVIEGMPIRFTQLDIDEIIQNNYVILDGDTAKTTLINWSPWFNKAAGNFEIKRNVPNITTVIIDE
jgi:hypothetical protein